MHQSIALHIASAVCGQARSGGQNRRGIDAIELALSLRAQQDLRSSLETVSDLFFHAQILDAR